MSANNMVPGVIKFKRGTVVPNNLQEGELFIKQVGTKRLLFTNNGVNSVLVGAEQSTQYVVFTYGTGAPESVVYNPNQLSVSIQASNISGNNATIELRYTGDRTTSVMVLHSVIKNATPEVITGAKYEPVSGGYNITETAMDQSYIIICQILPIPENIIFDI
jgi:hypothetical protein